MEMITVLDQKVFEPRPDREEVFSWLRCGEGLPCREAYEAAWEEAAEMLRREADPRAVILRERPDRITLLITLGRGPEERVSALFREGRYVEGELLNVLCDEMLFQMDDRTENVLRSLLAREGMSMARRAEPGYGLDAAEQEHFFERIGSTIPEAHLTEHGALSPAKSMMYGVELSREECHTALHDCSRCPKTDCLYRKVLN